MSRPIGRLGSTSGVRALVLTETTLGRAQISTCYWGRGRACWWNHGNPVTIRDAVDGFRMALYNIFADA